MKATRLRLDFYTAASGVAAVFSLAVCTRELALLWAGTDEVSLSALALGIVSFVGNVGLYHKRT
jgi:hypothetical protein